MALGLGLVTVVFTFSTRSASASMRCGIPESCLPSSGGGIPAPTSRSRSRVSHYDSLRRDTSVFTDAVALLRGVATRIDGRRRGTLVTGNFFQVLGVSAALGRTLTPGDDVRFGGRPVIVLSHKGWTRWFASERPSSAGAALINGVRFEVVGVAPEGFRGLSIGAPDYWAPLSLVAHFRRPKPEEKTTSPLTSSAG